jgi:deazaflavin-dependent oxidoreductase (nitroreductase family)
MVATFPTRTPSIAAAYRISCPVSTHCRKATQPAPSRACPAATRWKWMRPGHGLNGRSAPDNRQKGMRLVRYTPAATLQFPYLKLHQFLYRHSRGLIGSRIVAGRALLLTTTGRRSGEPRTCALIYLKDDERLVVVASNGGSDHPPSWLLNLQAHPDVGVQIGRKKFSARASVASAGERERLWPRVNRHNMGLAPIMHPGARGRYDVYQRHTTRLIPLVLLVPSAE